jgi:hypothetical protein
MEIFILSLIGNTSLLIATVLINYRPQAKDELSRDFDKRFLDGLGGRDFLRLVVGTTRIKSYYSPHNSSLPIGMFYTIEINTGKTILGLFRPSIMFVFWCRKIHWNDKSYREIFLTEVKFAGKKALDIPFHDVDNGIVCNANKDTIDEIVYKMTGLSTNPF